MAAPTFDVAVVGAGIAGASAAYWLAGDRRVLLLEMEDFPGYHTTGRSAAFFSEAYGAPVMRALTVASRHFFDSPLDGFCEQPLLRASGALYIARNDQIVALERMFAEQAGLLEKQDGAFARNKVELLAPGYVAACLWEPGACEIDVAALHQGYLRGAKQNGAELHCRAELVAARHENGAWRIETRGGEFSARVLVNAAGAWADKVAAMAGIAALGVTPLRRTASIIPSSGDAQSRRWPLVIDVDEEFYFKPDAGNLLLSPADETASSPCDAAPEEIDVAIAIERFERATTIRVTRVLRSWAGLRTVTPDGAIALGFDTQHPAFFWLVGQGGQGIQTSPAAGRCAAALIRSDALPSDVIAHGVSIAAISPARFR